MSCPHEEEVEPSGAAMAAADEDDAHDHFAKFFECWLTQQERDLQSLRAAADGSTGGPDDEARLRALIDRVLGHYEYYYRAKAASARHDVTPMFAPTWTSSTENLFLWAGGWRPTMAFHLLYSKSGLQLVSWLADQNLSPPTADLASLTCDQLERIDRLHRRTVRLEQQISEQEAQAQETVADAQMVELSHVMAASGDAMGGAGEEMERAMEGKRERMNEVLDRADELRLETLKAVVDILKPAQAVHFLIAAAELHLKVHEFGKSKDAAAAPTTGRETAASS